MSSSVIAKNFQNIVVSGITPVSNTSPTSITVTNITATNLVVTAATIPNIILSGSLNANFNSNTMANIYTTGGNVGINTSTPAFTLDISGTSGVKINSNANTIGGLIVTNNNTSATLIFGEPNHSIYGRIGYDGILNTINFHSLSQFRWYTSGVPGTLLMTLTSTGNLSLPSITTSTINSTNITSTNIVSTNSSLGTINSTGLTTGNINFTGNLFQNGVSYLGSQWTTTAGNLSYTSGNVVVSNLSVGNSITTVSLLATTSISSGSIYSSNLTASNIYASSTFSAASGLLTTATVSTLAATNISSSNMTISSILATTSISSSGLYSTNSTSTNIVATAISASNIIGSTSISTAAIYGLNQTTTNIVGTSISAANISSTSISSAALYSLNQTSTNIVATTISASSITSTNISSAGLFSLNQTTTNAVYTTLTSANIFTTTTGSVLSDGLNLRLGASILTISNSKGAYTFGSDPTDTNRQVYLVSNIPGTSNILTFRNNTTNILYDFINEGTGRNRFVIQQSNNASAVNPYFIIDPTNPSISLMSNTGINTTSPAYTLDISGTTRINNTLLATFNSNTIGNIFTTGGNVGINTTSPNFTLDVNGSGRFNNNGLVINNVNSLYTNQESSSNAFQIYSSNGIATASLYMGADSTNNICWVQSSKSGSGLPFCINPRAGGNVGINTNSPQFSLDVNGSARISGSINALRFNSYTGTINISATGTYNISPSVFGYIGKISVYIGQITSGVWGAQGDLIMPTNSNIRGNLSNITQYQFSNNQISATLQPFGGSNNNGVTNDSPSGSVQVVVTTLGSASTIFWTLTIFSSFN